MIKDTLLRFDRDQEYMVFDTETEGLNLVESKPWQVAWIIAKGNKILDKQDLYIRWDDLNISDEAAKVTGFNRREYDRRAKDPKEVFDLFWKEISKEHRFIVGQNLLGFDIYMVNVWRKLLGLPSDYKYINRILDTRCMAMAIGKEIPVDTDNLLSWQYKMLNNREKRIKCSQITLLKNYGIPFDPKRLHDALYDVEMNYEVFKKQLFDIEL